MKTKHISCITAAAVATGAGEKMKSVIFYPYGPLTGFGCFPKLHAKNLAASSAIYTINISLLIVLIYSWRINVNKESSGDLEDVYYGVQIAYFAIIGTQMSIIALSVMLMFGIYKENPGLIVPWIIGYITFMALEAVAMVYSNVLRDHVNKQFDALCKLEVAFFIARAFINVLVMWGVLRFYNLLRSGITWRGPEAKTTTTTFATQPIVYNECQSGSRQRYSQSSESLSPVECCDIFNFENTDDGYAYQDDNQDYCEQYFDKDNESEEAGDNVCNIFEDSSSCELNERNSIHPLLTNSKRYKKYKINHMQARLEVINESEHSAADTGSEENDSLLALRNDSASLSSV
uniref:Uncharacterized protein n=1 Tax=Glossina brevipalpis TaxID=37001 RepID=A0A1A9WA97_9MUSC